MERAKNKDTQRGTELLWEQWRRHIKAWQASGDTQVSFCQKHGLSRHAFQYWKRNLRKSRTSRFVEITPAMPPISGGLIEILIDNRVQIRVPQGVSPEHILMVLQAVKEL